MPDHLVPRLQIVLTALLFSTGGAAIKASALAPWQIACFRNGLAAVALWVLLPAARRISWRSLAVGVAYAATTISFTMANRLTTAASSIFLEYTAPLYVLVLGWWLLEERVDRRGLLFGLALAAGMALVFLGTDPPAATAPDPAAGRLVAAGCGLFWGLTILGLRLLGRGTESRAESAAAVLSGNLIAAVVAAPFAFPVTAQPPGEWALVIYLGAVQIGLAYILLTAALRSVPAFEASLLLLLDLVLSPVWAWWVHGEAVGRWTVAGGAVILVATALHLLRGDRST